MGSKLHLLNRLKPHGSAHIRTLIEPSAVHKSNLITKHIYFKQSPGELWWKMFFTMDANINGQRTVQKRQKHLQQSQAQDTLPVYLILVIYLLALIPSRK